MLPLVLFGLGPMDSKTLKHLRKIIIKITFSLMLTNAIVPQSNLAVRVFYTQTFANIIQREQ